MPGISSPVQVTAMRLSNKLSYPQRLFLWLLGYSALLVGCYIAFQYSREREFKAMEMNSRLQLINTYLLTELEEGRDIADVSLHDFHPFDDIRVSVIKTDGTVVYDNSIDSLPGKNHLDREEIRRALAHKSGYTLRRHSESTGDTYFYSATRGDKGYIVRTAVPYSISLSSLMKPDVTFLWIMGAVALVMCVLGYFATRRVGQHITRLKQFAEDVENGLKISDSEPFPNDELGSISNNIVRLYVRLQEANSDRDRQHKAALHEQQEKERIKKQLTNNINHELKTPVSSIKVCLETLLTHKNISADRRDEFLRRCMMNTERLQHLLADVALITRMDSGASTIMKESVDLALIVRDVVNDRSVIAESKGFVIENGISGSLTMSGNRSLLEAIFNNLIDNAIAYSGGNTVRIGLLYEDDKKIVLILSDNGAGVAEEHLSRMFERFYRIDKGRSRAAGGTGLGLSIVRNAVMMHGGIITAENLCTGGLQFTISLSRTDVRMESDPGRSMT